MVLERQGQGTQAQGAWLGTSDCFSRILKKAKDFTRLAWSLVFLGDKSNSIFHFILKANSISLWKILADARKLSGNETPISRVVGTGRAAHRRKER